MGIFNAKLEGYSSIYIQLMGLICHCIVEHTLKQVSSTINSHILQTTCDSLASVSWSPVSSDTFTPQPSHGPGSLLNTPASVYKVHVPRILYRTTATNGISIHLSIVPDHDTAVSHL